MSNARWLRAAFEDNAQVEVRGLLRTPHDGMSAWTGLYNNPTILVQDVKDADQSGEFKGLYVLLNRPIKRRATNRLHPAYRTTRDQDIERITRLPIDFDPVRDEANSTDSELAEAKARAEALARFLKARGWPEPLHALSGNGWHLQYRVDMPADQETKGLLDAIYRGLRLRFDSPEVSFDASIRNPARIFRFYGTTARKGDATPDRPQRVTRCWTPERWQHVDLDLIEALADEVRPPKPKLVSLPRATNAPMGRGDYRTLDVVAWFASHGQYLKDMGGGKHAVTCPWAGEHSEGSAESATVVWEAAGGWPSFRCLHAHCDHRRIADVMALLGDADQFCRTTFTRNATAGAGALPGGAEHDQSTHAEEYL